MPTAPDGICLLVLERGIEVPVLRLPEPGITEQEHAVCGALQELAVEHVGDYGIEKLAVDVTERPARAEKPEQLVIVCGAELRQR